MQRREAIIDLGARKGWVVNTTIWPPYPRKTEPLPTVQLGATQGRCGQVKKILPHWGSNTNKVIVSYITVF